MLALPEQIVISLFFSIYTLVHYAYIMNLEYFITYVTRFIYFFIGCFALIYGLQSGPELSNKTIYQIIIVYILFPYLLLILDYLLKYLFSMEVKTLKGRFNFVFFILGLLIFLTLLQLMPSS